MNAGFNLVRLFLAFNVVFFHLWNAAAPGAGPVAVLGFFFISGFLITQIVQEVYASPPRPWAFLLNRMLRIYPQYLSALGFGLIAVYFYPDVASHINGYQRWPAGAAEWVSQFAIFGLYESDVRILPAAWSLGTELYFYLLIGLVTARSRKSSLALCLVSLPVGALCALKLLPFGFYGHPVGNGFVFALGSVAYFYRNSVRIRTPIFVLSCAAYLAHSYAIPALEQADVDNANLAGSVLSFSLILLYLFQHEIRQPSVAGIANLLGKIAYPMFLLHWAVSVVISAWVFHGAASYDMRNLREGGEYFLVMLFGVFFCSMLFYGFIDRPIEKYRQIIRRGSPPAAA